MTIYSLSASGFGRPSGLTLNWRVGSVNNGRPRWNDMSITYSGTNFSASSPTTSYSKGSNDWGFIVDLGSVYTNWSSVIFYNVSGLGGTYIDLEGGVSDTSPTSCFTLSSNPDFVSYGNGFRLVLTPADFSASVEGSAGAPTTKNNVRYIGFGNGDAGSTISGLSIQGFRLTLSSGATYVVGADPGT